MLCKTTHGAIQRILIECPIQLRADLGGRDRDYETFFGVHCLKLLIQPDQYKPVSVYKNGDPEYVRQLSATQFAVRAFEAGFELKITDPHDHLFYLLQGIATQSTSLDRQNKQDLKVFDFVLPEFEDVVIARQTNAVPFTLRTGTIDSPQAEGGRAIGSRGQGWIQGGYTLKFREKAMRIR
jgi:hypothetical protein